ncbi:MAG TPA: NAD-dependent epimerase/dehydratase family protein [Polyangia bacterium]
MSDFDERLPAVVTGASGHIGANLVRALLGQGRRVRALVHRQTKGIDGLPVEVLHVDLLDKEALLRACVGAGTVFHLAGKISAGWEDDDLVSTTNVTGTSHVIEACLAASVRRLVHFSSIQALDCGPGRATLDETCDLVAPDDRSRGVYDRAKAEAERLVLSAAEGGLDAVVVNPTGVLGPFDFQPSPMGEVLVKLGQGRLPALVAGAACDFVDVRDVVAGALACERTGRRGERYILSGTRLSLVQLAHKWAIATTRAAPKFAVPMGLARVGAPFASTWARWRGRRPLYTSESLRVLRSLRPVVSGKAASDLAYRPRPIEETLRETHAWMKTQGWL